MPTYFYTAKSLGGESKSSTKVAKNERELAKLLHQEGYVLISASEEGTGMKKSKFTISLPFLSFLKKVSLTEKMMFVRNLQVMVAAGITLPRALQILGNQAKSRKFKQALLDANDEITKGKTFAQGLSRHPDVFPELFQNMVKVGEETGTLEEALKILSKQMEREYELKSKIKGAMTYPAIIITAMIGIGILMMIVVVPKLSETFEELKIELPVTTKLVITTGNLLARFWYLLPVVILVLFALFKTLLSLKSGKRMMDGLLLRTPVIAPIIKKANAASTVRTLSSLITSGVPIVNSLEIISRTLGNVYFREALEEAAQNVKKGAHLAESLKPFQNLYPLLVIQMLEVGEETGQTSEILGKLADFYEEEVTNTTKNLATIIEPILMIFIGGAIGFFAVAMVQPMYSMLGTL